MLAAVQLPSDSLSAIPFLSLLFFIFFSIVAVIVPEVEVAGDRTAASPERVSVHE